MIKIVIQNILYKTFEPFDWHIGTGEYIDELTKNNQEEIIN